MGIKFHFISNSSRTDITTGIFQISDLFEIRFTTNLDSIVGKMENKVNPQEVSYYSQAIIVDTVQQCFAENCVKMRDNHLEIIVRKIFFIKVINDPFHIISSGELLPYHYLVRKNALRLLSFNPHKKQNKKVDTKSKLLGLTSSSLFSR